MDLQAGHASASLLVELATEITVERKSLHADVLGAGNVNALRKAEQLLSGDRIHIYLMLAESDRGSGGSDLNPHPEIIFHLIAIESILSSVDLKSLSKKTLCV